MIEHEEKLKFAVEGQKITDCFNNSKGEAFVRYATALTYVVESKAGMRIIPVPWNLNCGGHTTCEEAITCAETNREKIRAYCARNLDETADFMQLLAGAADRKAMGKLVIYIEKISVEMADVVDIVEAQSAGKGN